MNDEKLIEFKGYLINEEKSTATIEKYMRDVRAFLVYMNGREISKSEMIEYKEYLNKHYAPASINSMLVAINVFLRFLNRADCCVKLFRIQRQMFCTEDKELTKEEYHRLVKAAKDTRLSYIIQTICGTGIRVSELKYITVEAVYAGKAVVSCKNKTRNILIPTRVCKMLTMYIKKTGLKTGTVFITKNGKPLHRSNIWREMKELCRKAKVSEEKVFPHNLRHLFARTFYSINRDIVRLADLLGHSSINTTRIYTIESGELHLNCLEKVQRLLTT